jgi:hypothetical protein
MQERIETIADDTQNTHVISRFSPFRQKTRRNASFIFSSTCQSEIKRTLRQAAVRAWSALCRGFDTLATAELTAMVNTGFPQGSCYGFEMVHAGAFASDTGRITINRKFTANPPGGIFRKFSPS